MTYAIAAALQKAVFERLASDATIVGLVDDAVYDAIPHGMVRGTYVALGPEDVRDAWLRRADVAAAVGFAWGETGAYAEAIDWLEKAMRYDVGDCPVRAVEQCANFKVRLAGQTWAQLRQVGPADETQRGTLVARIEGAINELDLICQRLTGGDI